MPVSVADVFAIGIGPSSSHTVGPMRAALDFIEGLADQGLKPDRIAVELFGSLALTGEGHATDRALILGLAGHRPESIDPEAIDGILTQVRETCKIRSPAGAFAFDPATSILWRRGEFIDAHSNTMRFLATLADGREERAEYYSIGGGAIQKAGEGTGLGRMGDNIRQPHPFSSGAELLAIGEATGLGFASIMLRNERAWRDNEATLALIDGIAAAMSASIDRGMRGEGLLPGGLKVRRRAAAIHSRLRAQPRELRAAQVFDWVSLFALAVNEENAAGGRVVTAPTNGAAGVIPAVIRYFEMFVPGACSDGVRCFLLTAAAIGALYKKRASISAAEMGCQGEVGVACSMAAAGLTAALGGTNAQVENAAEIGMEHNLGLTCDPIGGLVQIPCIERNTMGAVKAINAAYLALQGDGRHIVSLDAVIETMRQTGQDMQTKYKESSLGGLAVNFVEC